MAKNRREEGWKREKLVENKRDGKSAGGEEGREGVGHCRLDGDKMR